MSPSSPIGHYQYEEIDREFLKARVDEFAEQVERRLSGKLTEDEFKPLRLMNGLYLQLHAYMLRVAIPYGVLDSRQMRQFAHIAKHYDRGYGHLTTRQNIQFNWISLEQTPEILRQLAHVDMHAIQTSGNCIRNVTSDHFAGAAHDELFDPRVHAEILRQWSTLHPEFSFLPRKFKIAITGSVEDRVAARFHDIGILAQQSARGPVFRIFVGGGLGRTPLVGKELFDDVAEWDLLKTVEAVLRVYNAHGRRDNIYKARLKILLQHLGIEEFRRQVAEEIQTMDDRHYALRPEIVDKIKARFAVPSLTETDAAEAEISAHRQQDENFDLWMASNVTDHKNDAYAVVTISVKSPGEIPGDLTSDQMARIAALADEMSFGEIRVSHLQNLVFGHVARKNLFRLWSTLREIGLGGAANNLIGDIIACPGLDYCALANARSIPIAQKLSQRFASFALQKAIGPISINISGCINACGHHHVGNIGLLGVDKRGEEFFQITLGGRAGEDGKVGSILGAALKEDEMVDAIARIIERFLELRAQDETFLATLDRLGELPFKEAAYETV